MADEKYDLGIGGLNFADSLLFRQLDVYYIKLSEEDVESYAMQVKLNMPVLTSMYHSAEIANLFEYYATPEFQTLGYRWPFFKNYQINKYKKFQHIKDMKAILKPQYHDLIDKYDQDHAMILGQGTAGDIYQSIMVKPPNIKPVYPMVKQDTREEIVLDDKFDQKEYIYIFNAGKNTPDNTFYDNPKALANFVEGKDKETNVSESRF